MQQMKEKSVEDVRELVSLLRERQSPFFIPSKIKRGAAWRMLAARFFFKSQLNIKDFLKYLWIRRSQELIYKVRDLAIADAKKIIAQNVGNENFFVWNGVHVRVPKAGILEGWFSVLEWFQQVVIEDQYDARKFLKPDSVILDIGANIGLFSLHAKSIHASVEVFAFEPRLETFELLSQNLANYSDIRVIRAGAGDRSGEALLYLTESLGSSTLTDSGMLESNTLEKEQVPIITIDEFAETAAVKKVDFIKIDTEGYEKQILKGAQKVIQQFRPVLAISAYHFTADQEDIPKLVFSIDSHYHCILKRGLENVFIFVPTLK